MTPKTREQVERAYAVLDHIEKNPDKHNQEFWISLYRPTTAATVMSRCGTAACYAGWTVLLAGFQVERGRAVVGLFDDDGDQQSVADAASNLLGLTYEEGNKLFREAGDLADVRKAVFEIFGPRPDGAR